ncbi:MAG: prepilin-type N-terminal cleavage/methylation domain-containing protein [Sedimentisphaerales bacterium]|nr:prepilin-type N-terminal cleavage/methylation domain-containing protein [Sedimentisphaerales bacterium]
MTSGRNNAGFTLIEMLVSLTIIAAILAMVYSSFAATTRSIDASTARLADTERACFALRLMARQLRCAYVPGPAQSLSAGPHEPHMTGDSAALLDITTVSPLARSTQFRGDSRDPQGRVLSFITSSGLGAGPDAPRGLFHVTYLYNKVSSTLSVSRRNQADSWDGRSRTKRPELLLSDVSGIELKFHDGRQWRPTWDAAQRHELPRAVKLEIALVDEAGNQHLLRTTVPIMQETYPESQSTRRAVAAGQL